MVLGRRRHPRICVDWPAVVLTAQGSVEGRTRNISLEGVFVECSEFPEDKQFQIVFKPSKQRSIQVAAEKVWSGNLNFDGVLVYGGMGVRFTRISPGDRGFISDIVDEDARE
jgi:hypothetical protein